MKETLIVTAFFDIGRGKYKNFQRSNEKYLNWFRRWSRIQNRMVIYLQDDYFIEQTKKIRDSYGLLDKTIIVKVDNYETISSDILNRWKEIEKDKDFLEFRDHKTNPENKAKYNYVNLIKSYFMADAAKNYLKDGYVAWMDFGFEHGGIIYEDENDYNFLWQYDFGDKINLFYKGELIKDPIFKLVKNYRSDCFLGMTLVAPKNLAQKFWEVNLESANILADVGFMDDDQLIYLFSSRRYPELFELRKSDVFKAVYLYGGSHFKLKPQLTFMQKVKRKIKRMFKEWKERRK